MDSTEGDDVPVAQGKSDVKDAVDDKDSKPDGKPQATPTSLKPFGFSRFASIPPQTVPQGHQSWEHFHSLAVAYRVHAEMFVMSAYDPKTKKLDFSAFEIVVKTAGGKWRCRCSQFGVSEACFHVVSAAVWESSLKPLGSLEQEVTECNSQLWAVLGGQGTYRSLVQLRDNKVSPLLILRDVLVQLCCDSAFCQSHRRRGGPCVHVAAVADLKNMHAAVATNSAASDEAEVADQETETECKLEASISDHDVFVPVPEHFVSLISHGCDRKDCVPKEGLRPLIAAGQKCKCEQPSPYRFELTSPDWVREGDHDYRLIFISTKAEGVRRWALHCPSHNPICLMRYDPRQHGLWECTNQTMISEQLFYECFFQVRARVIVIVDLV